MQREDFLALYKDQNNLNLIQHAGLFKPGWG